MKQSKQMIFLLTVICITSWSSAGEWSLTWHTTDSGGAIDSQEGSFSLSGTMGQVDAGKKMIGGSFAITGGFWALPTPACGDSGDFDGDGDVDLVDFGEFQLCFSGPDVVVEPSCRCADLDGDNDADLVDFGAFQLAYTG